MEVDAPALADRLKTLKAKRASLQSQIGTASAREPAHRQCLTEAKLNKLSVAIHGALRDQLPEIPKAYLKLFVTTSSSARRKSASAAPKACWLKRR